jgi:methionine synthase II (cobalamin-independent)
MVAQFLSAVPGATLDGTGVTLPAGFGDEAAPPAFSLDTLPGLEALLRHTPGGGYRKGQVTGPITAALHARLADGRTVSDDPAAAAAVAAVLAQAAQWQFAQLSGGNSTPVIFIDEPGLPQGLAAPALGWEVCAALLSGVLQAIHGVRGVHCCGEPDLAFLAALPTDIISFDALRYADELDAAAVAGFLRRGGAIAWGIVPAEETAILAAAAEPLTERLLALWRRLAEAGVPTDLLWRQSLITPVCGLGAVSERAAEQALRLTAAVAAHLRGMGSPLAAGAAAAL